MRLIPISYASLDELPYNYKPPLTPRQAALRLLFYGVAVCGLLVALGFILLLLI